MYDGLGLYINEELFAKAGVSDPVTWEDVLTIVPRLTVKEGVTITTSAIALGTTGNVENWSDILGLMMLQNGANIVGLSGKEAEETVLFYRKFADPIDPMYTWNETLDNSIYAFAIGKTAMIIAPSWRAFDVKQISPGLRFKIIPVPQLPGNTVSWASYWVEGVSGKSKHERQAFEFLRYLTSRETAMKLYSEAAKTRLFGEIYARKDLGSTIEADPFAGAYAKQAKSAKSFPLASRTFDNGLNDKLIKYLEDGVNAVAAGSAPSGALATAAQGFRQVLGQYGLTTGSAPPASQ
jgi:multiple sugar transport system substrate-binding protein